MKKANSLFGLIFFVVFTALFFFSIFVDCVEAVSVSLSDVPTTITSEPFTLQASVSGAQAGTNYLKIDLFKDGSINYFGETNTPQGWYGGSDWSQAYPITIISNAPWSGHIQGRLGSPSTTQYDGTGIYKLRVRRYTSSGSSIASEAFTVAIAVPTQTPTPTITPTPTNEPTPTRTPTPTKTPTPSPTLADEDEPLTPTISKKNTSKISPGGVLGTGTQSAVFEIPTATPFENPTPTIHVKGVENSQNTFALFSIGGGVLLLLSYAILKIQPWLKNLWKKK